MTPFRRLPKVDLHLHLDGAVRVGTILDLGRRRGATLPARTAVGLLPRVTVRRRCRDLAEFLHKFDVIYPVLRSAEAHARIAYELCEDQAADGVAYFETRFAPVLMRAPGVSMEDVVRGTLEGLRRGGRDFGVRWGLILCLYRGADPESSVETVRLARAHRSRGVVGIDLAGDEARHPARIHAEAFALARKWGIPVTVHAGEAGPAANIAEAVAFGASRIGHGSRILDDPRLAASLAKRGTVLEVCLTSNVHTGTVPSVAAHPLPRLRAMGVRVTLNTDDPAISRIRLSGEYAAARKAFRLTPVDFVDLLDTAVDGSFAPAAAKREVRRRIHREWRRASW